MKKFDVSIKMTCRTYGIKAKSEEKAKVKALKLMLKKALEKEPTFWDEVQDLETTFVVDSDDYYEPDKSEIKSLNFPEGCEIESEPEINGVKSLNFRSKT